MKTTTKTHKRSLLELNPKTKTTIEQIHIQKAQAEQRKPIRQQERKNTQAQQNRISKTKTTSKVDKIQQQPIKKENFNADSEQIKKKSCEEKLRNY